MAIRVQHASYVKPRKEIIAEVYGTNKPVETQKPRYSVGETFFNICRAKKPDFAIVVIDPYECPQFLLLQQDNRDDWQSWHVVKRNERYDTALYDEWGNYNRELADLWHARREQSKALKQVFPETCDLDKLLVRGVYYAMFRECYGL